MYKCLSSAGTLWISHGPQAHTTLWTRYHHKAQKAHIKDLKMICSVPQILGAGKGEWRALRQARTLSSVHSFWALTAARQQQVGNAHLHLLTAGWQSGCRLLQAIHDLQQVPHQGNALFPSMLPDLQQDARISQEPLGRPGATVTAVLGQLSCASNMKYSGPQPHMMHRDDG